MAKRGTTTSEAASVPGRKPKALGILTLLLTLYAAGVSTLLLARGGGGGSAGKTPVKGDFDPDRIARDVQLAVQSDLKRATSEQKELLGDAIRRVDALKANLKELTDAAIKRTEEVSRTSSGRAEVLEARINDVAQAADGLKPTLEALVAQVKALESRPAAAGPVVSAPVPGKPPAVAPPTPPPGPTPGAAPEGPSPEEIAANKDKVKAAIADLASPDIVKVFQACLLLQKLRDLEAVEPLLKVLRDYRDPYGRTAAATALGTLQACDAVPGLIAAFLDKDAGVFLAASQSFGKITAQDSGLSGDASRKDKTDAKEKWTRWWKDHEGEVRTRLKQPKADAPPDDGPK